MSAQRPRLPTNTSHLGQRNSAAPKPEMRRTAISALVAPGGPKNQRTTKTSQKLVMLPSAPQTKPLDEDSEMLGYETDAGVREHKTDAERMSKDQRRRAGFKRLTAYCVAESFKMKLLSSFLKREHNVAPRVFDEALYAVRSPFHDANAQSTDVYSPRCTTFLYYLAMVLARISDLLCPQKASK